MWLVGYLHNNNGMGTWCWEAAHALNEAGEDVVLVCSSAVELPGDCRVRVLRLDGPTGRSFTGRLFGDGGLVSPHGPRVVREALRRLEHEGHRVEHVLLNASEFYDETLHVRQYVVAWARGISLAEYLRRFATQRRTRRFHPRGFLRELLSTIGWWRRDWFAFHRADRVLAVTTPLDDELRAHGIHSSLLYPCTHITAGPARSVIPGAGAEPPVIHAVTSAVDLEDPRKQVVWMLDALRGARNLEVALIGRAGETVRDAVARTSFRTRLTGELNRREALEAIRANDVFLFASALDDWGYVLVEAMAEGLAVVAPNAAPFTEILGDTGVLYRPGDQESFVKAVEQLSSHVAESRVRSRHHAEELFSRQRFVTRLRSIIARHGH